MARAPIGTTRSFWPLPSRTTTTPRARSEIVRPQPDQLHPPQFPQVVGLQQRAVAHPDRRRGVGVGEHLDDLRVGERVWRPAARSPAAARARRPGSRRGRAARSASDTGSSRRPAGRAGSTRSAACPSACAVVIEPALIEHRPHKGPNEFR
jgi:hypothetical protein